MIKSFTPEEIEVLRKNPNTWSITSKRIGLTKAAKERIIELLAKGYSSKQCIADLGYDTEILGKIRCYSIVRHVKEDIAQGKEVHEGYPKYKPKRLTAEELDQLPMDQESYIRMKNELVYLRQEVDFLKKISQLDKSKKRDD